MWGWQLVPDPETPQHGGGEQDPAVRGQAAGPWDPLMSQSLEQWFLICLCAGHNDLHRPQAENHSAVPKPLNNLLCLVSPPGVGPGAEPWVLGQVAGTQMSMWDWTAGPCRGAGPWVSPPTLKPHYMGLGGRTLGPVLCGAGQLEDGPWDPCCTGPRGWTLGPPPV